jgi:hypothetical protein
MSRDLAGSRPRVSTGAGLPSAGISALDALRPAGPGNQCRTPAFETSRTQAEDVGRQPAGRHSYRPGGFDVRRRRSSQGLGTSAHPEQHPGVQGSRLPPDA